MPTTQQLSSVLLGGLLALGQPSPAAEQEQVSTISQFSDVQPSDWAYQALSNLIERYGCVAGYPNGRVGGNQAISRYEAAALLNACLDRVTEVTDALKRLTQEFAQELAVLRGRVDALDAKVGVLEALQFSTTTKLRGEVNFVLGGNHFGGSDSAMVQDSRGRFGATTFNYDLRLNLETSFTGEDTLHLKLRTGDFDESSNSFYGAGPSALSTLEVAFLEEGRPNDLAVYKLYYQTPVGGGFTTLVGARVEQTDLFALWPSVYPETTVLDWFTLSGSPTAYDNELGTGASLWWESPGGFSLSAGYVATNGSNGDPQNGGIATAGSLGTASVQLGFLQPQWAIAGVYSRIQNGDGAIPYATNFTLNSVQQPGTTHAFALGGYWQPLSSGWMPSISAGWSINGSSYERDTPSDALVSTSQSWSVGIQWADVLWKQNTLGMAVGQPPFATRLVSGEQPNDGNYAWEWWYAFQVSDNLAVTPALFYLSRPLGADTAPGESFNQLGALVKTTFRF